jgi:hypothetical protein
MATRNTVNRSGLVIALEALPIATILMVIVAIAGAVVSIVHPENLGFDQYIRDLAVGAGLLGIGRGIAAKKVA